MLIKYFGTEKIIDDIISMGRDFWWTGFPVIILLFFFNNVFLTYAWKILINYDIKSSYFFNLLMARIAGDSTSSINGLGAIAGEPLKAMLIKDTVPFRIGLASVILDRTIHTVSSVILILTGLLVGFVIIDNTEKRVAFLLIFLLFSSGLVFALFLIRKQRGALIESIINKFPGKLVSKFMTAGRLEKIRNIDTEIGKIFSSRNSKKRFAASLFIRSLSVLAAGTMEVFIIFLFLKSSFPLEDALFVYVFSLFITSFTFFVPGNLGTIEGSYAIALQLLGYHEISIGVTAGVIRRLRTFVWAGIGMLIGFLKK